MKKLKLKLQELTNPAILTRQQLKNVMGGDMNGSGSGTGKCAVNCPMPDGGVSYNLSYADAIDLYNQCVSLGVSDAHWCCDSCSTASWYHPNN